MVHSAQFALLLSTLAGLATAIGGLSAFLTRRTNTKFLAASLGFSAGVMVYISMIEMLPDAKRILSNELGVFRGSVMAVAAFFLGMMITAVIDMVIPSVDNIHEPHRVEEMGKKQLDPKLLRSGIFTAVAIAIHNFPEGFATFISALSDTRIGVLTAFAVGMHNIPEGIVIAVLIYFATRDRTKALVYSLLSGLTEPLGALICYVFLHNYLNQTTLAILFAFVAGIMVFISFDELLPAAHKYGEHHVAVYALMLGMLFMAGASLAFV